MSGSSPIATRTAGPSLELAPAEAVPVPRAGLSGSPAARRVLLALGVAALAGAWVFAAIRLWRTSVPGDLTPPGLDPHRYFSDAQLDRVASYRGVPARRPAAGLDGALVALGLFAVRGARFVRESAAGRIGTGMLLGMLGLGFVWLAQFPFGLAALWWEREHDISNQGYVDVGDQQLPERGRRVPVHLAGPADRDGARGGAGAAAWWLLAAPALVRGGSAVRLRPALPDSRPRIRSVTRAVAADARQLAARGGRFRHAGACPGHAQPGRRAERRGGGHRPEQARDPLGHPCGALSPRGDACCAGARVRAPLARTTS